MSVMEEFYSKYNKPYIGSITVGFSGIDPAPLGSGSSASSSAPVSESPAFVDVGSIPEEVLYGADHEGFENIMGGDEGGHWHLTTEEYSKLLELLENASAEQSGNETWYRLSEEEYRKLVLLLEKVYSEDESEPVLVDESRINELIDAKIENLLSDEDLSGIIDARIQEYLDNA